MRIELRRSLGIAIDTAILESLRLDTLASLPNHLAHLPPNKQKQLIKSKELSTSLACFMSLHVTTYDSESLTSQYPYFLAQLELLHITNSKLKYFLATLYLYNPRQAATPDNISLTHAFIDMYQNQHLLRFLGLPKPFARCIQQYGQLLCHQINDQGTQPNTYDWRTLNEVTSSERYRHIHKQNNYTVLLALITHPSMIKTAIKVMNIYEQIESLLLHSTALLDTIEEDNEDNETEMINATPCRERASTTEQPHQEPSPAPPEVNHTSSALFKPLRSKPDTATSSPSGHRFDCHGF